MGAGVAMIGGRDAGVAGAFRKSLSNGDSHVFIGVGLVNSE
jgi:hypothetical protein